MPEPTIPNGGHASSDPDTGAPLPGLTQLPPIPVPPVPRSLMEGALRIQRDAADLKSVVPWLERSPLLTDEQRYNVWLAHGCLTAAAYLLEEALGQARETFFGGGTGKGGSGSGGGG